MVNLLNARLTLHEGPSLRPQRSQEGESEERVWLADSGQGDRRMRSTIVQVPFDSLYGRIL
jgi:hypothetical protein